jgi:adenylate cyclase class 2
MQTEIEVKFIDVDIDAMREQLARAGAVCEEPMRLMRRALVETPEMAAIDAFLRLRDEGNKVTLTYKQHLKTGIEAAKEIETTVGDFDTTKAIIEASGLAFHTYQESRRETWRLGAVEVVIDEWPWMPPYVEIEGQSEQDVRTAAEILGFDWRDAVFGGADVIYSMLYDMADGVRGVIDIPDVQFDAPLPDVFTAKAS